MSLYRQEPEVHLLSALLQKLENRSVIDVGAERGSFATAMLDAGATDIQLFEPEPDNAAYLRATFAGDERVSVDEFAVTSFDHELVLHKSVTVDGEPLSFGHTVLDVPSTDEIAWRDSVVVQGRALKSLLAAGQLPVRVGILKVDTEGHDLAVIEGLGSLEADVIMVEHWFDLPNSLGRCPWTTAEMVDLLAARGFSHFAFIVHQSEFRIVQWDDGVVDRGGMGNMIFLHDRVLGRLAPVILETASKLGQETLRLAEVKSQAATERLLAIERLDRRRGFGMHRHLRRLVAPHRRTSG